MGGGAVRMLKNNQNIYKSIGHYFAQTGNLIHIYNGMYPVCSYDTPQRTVYKQA